MASVLVVTTIGDDGGGGSALSMGESGSVSDPASGSDKGRDVSSSAALDGISFKRSSLHFGRA